MFASACSEGTAFPVATASSLPVETSASISVPASTSTSSTAEPSSTNFQEQDPGSLEPTSPAPISVRYFDKTGSYFSGHGLEYFQELDGPLVEVVELFDYGLAYQRSWEDNVIWLSTTTSDASEPRELLVGDESQRLELEGGEQLGTDTERPPLLYYQRHSPGSPETQESTLRSFNPATGEVTVIAQTGGWEWSTQFPYLTGGLALALVNADRPGMFIIDLEADRDVLVFDLPPVCPELGDRIYEHATMIDGQILGSRAIFNTHDGVVDRWGFYVLDPETCVELLIESYPWDNGAFYVESFVGSIANLKTLPDHKGEPLAAIRLDLTGSGDSVSSPVPGFQRPGYLS